MKLIIEIKEERIGGEMFGWTLLLKHGDSNFAGLPIYSVDEMREVSRALLDKADEIRAKELQNELEESRMTLNEFLELQRMNLVRFERAHIRGMEKFDWPTDQGFVDWEAHYKKWEDVGKDFAKKENE